ncbi:hypothetical protein [Streptomyces caniscabiei]|uniref:hypothetical protein n=1 Tax=Streptomyces caniscabiei TaxID=2746961 RepID=UPI0018733880|nr:hypothetical protein [Streptomyces caniscabiei]MBE4783913.1 hypothetical protein [Streptomyces caniscabiei]MBE4791588.1 hypothetical protein [Streptomyces caniscabiei]MDX3009175.1 hypothetical protein [Streptomyces caniscabiei]
MSVAVLVPWRPDGGPRQAVWACVRARWEAIHPSWEIVTGACPDGLWSKGAAVADALRQTAAEVLIVADADVWSVGTPFAVEEVRTGRARWAMPHQLVRRLTPEATQAVLAGAAMSGQPTQETHPGTPGGGLVVLSRDVLEGVPMDPAFTGWGQEDQAWALALQTLAGPMWRGDSDLFHLWHPPAPRRSRAVGSAESLARYRRYQAASGQTAQMRALVAEFCPTPLEGSPMTYRYRNANTGDEVEYRHRNARLEMLPNWSRVAAPQPVKAPEPKTPEPPAQDPPSSSPPAEPSARDSKAAWVEYATSRAQDSDEAAAIAALTKAELIHRYGPKEA